MERSRRPPDVEEALSSMLWTPYARSPSETSSSSDEADGPPDSLELNPSISNERKSTINNNNHKGFNFFCFDQTQSYSLNDYNRNADLHTSEKFNLQNLSTEFTVDNMQYLTPTYTNTSTSISPLTMVHSFTDNFLQYQINPNACQSPIDSTPTVTSFNNRCKTSASQLVMKERNNNNSNNGNIGDLYFQKQVRAAQTQKLNNTNTNKNLNRSDEFRVNQLHSNQSYNTTQFSCIEKREGDLPLSVYNCLTNVSRVRVSDRNRPPHIFGLDISKVIVSEGAMKVNVSSAPESGSTTVFVPSNGTIMGSLVPQPNLTIQVNQSDHINQQDVVNQSSGVSIVNCYRAVPVQVVNNNSNNKNINCNNSNNVSVSNKSELNSSEVSALEQQVNVKKNNHNHIEVCSDVLNLDMDAIQLDNSAEIERIFISTEVQTDNLQELRQNTKHITPTIIQTQPEVNLSREQRRRERRERRQLRRPPHPHPRVAIRPPFEILPDILHNQSPPPYATLPIPPTPILPPIISTMTVGGPSDDGRYAFTLPVIRRSPSERSGKGCCGQWFAGPPLRALIAVVALGGVACAIGGAALGVIGLAGPPTSHLTAALLMIGVGVILVTVSGAAWRLTAPGSPPCLGFTGADLRRCGRRQCGRTQHGLLYPEFQHRPPPPSYQASMQEYRLRLLLLDRERQTNVMRGGASPPPTYRSNNGTLIRAPLSTRFSSQFTAGSELSLPPSYRNLNHHQQQQHQQQQQQHNTRISQTVLDDTITTTTTTIATATGPETTINTIENELSIITADIGNNNLTTTQDINCNNNNNSPHQQHIQQHQLQQQNRIQKNLNKVIKNHNHNNSLDSNSSLELNNIKLNDLNLINNNNNNNQINNDIKNDLITIVTISGTNTEETPSELEILAHL